MRPRGEQDGLRGLRSGEPDTSAAVHARPIEVAKIPNEFRSIAAAAGATLSRHS